MSLEDLSSAALYKRRRQLLRNMPAVEEVLRGTLRTSFLRCGRPNCHCANGPGHGPKHYLSISQPSGRPRRYYVRNTDVERVRQSIATLNKLREILDQICAVNTELLRRHEDLG
jgi:hypothetical protein